MVNLKKQKTILTMYTIFVVAQREFFQRVRQKTFWIVLLLGPLFFLVALVVPIGLGMKNESTTQVLYVDESGELDDYLYSEQGITFVKTLGNPQDDQLKLKEEGFDGLVRIKRAGGKWRCAYYNEGVLGAKSPEFLKLVLRERIQRYELEKLGNVQLATVSFESKGSLKTTATDPAVGMMAGLFGAMLILVCINQFAQMVLRGVVEEKQNRISELILTSVKPLHFITGKIAGIASVAFVQILTWFSIMGLVTLFFYQHFQLDRFANAQLVQTLQNTADVRQTLEMNSMINAIGSLDVSKILLVFFFYFVFGYLFYSALFAMLGVMVGSDADAQQLAMPFALPLAIPVVMLQSLVDNPDSTLAHVLSILPFTSPTAILIRLPMGVDWGELLLSGLVLVLSFWGVAYISAKVYRMGVLMYGQRLTFMNVWKWISEGAH
jgi:ABC-2 type transport system permease protein